MWSVVGQALSTRDACATLLTTEARQPTRTAKSVAVAFVHRKVFFCKIAFHDPDISHAPTIETCATTDTCCAAWSQTPFAAAGFIRHGTIKQHPSQDIFHNQF